MKKYLRNIQKGPNRRKGKETEGPVETSETDKDMYNHLLPTANATPQIYGTPKLHKTGTRLRTIAESIRSVKTKALGGDNQTSTGSNRSTRQKYKTNKKTQNFNKINIETDEIFI